MGRHEVFECDACGDEFRGANIPRAEATRVQFTIPGSALIPEEEVDVEVCRECVGRLRNLMRTWREPARCAEITPEVQR